MNTGLQVYPEARESPDELIGQCTGTADSATIIPVVDVIELGAAYGMVVACIKIHVHVQVVVAAVVVVVVPE